MNLTRLITLIATISGRGIDDVTASMKGLEIVFVEQKSSIEEAKKQLQAMQVAFSAAIQANCDYDNFELDPQESKPKHGPYQGPFHLNYIVRPGIRRFLFYGSILRRIPAAYRSKFPVLLPMLFPACW